MARRESGDAADHTGAAARVHTHALAAGQYVGQFVLRDRHRPDRATHARQRGVEEGAVGQGGGVAEQARPDGGQGRVGASHANTLTSGAGPMAPAT